MNGRQRLPPDLVATMAAILGGERLALKRRADAVDPTMARARRLKKNPRRTNPVLHLYHSLLTTA